MSTEVGSPYQAAKWERQAALIVGLCFVVNMLDGMNIFVMSYIAPALTREWSVNQGQLSFVFSAGLFGMALGGFFGGPIADVLGRRTAIIGALVLMAAGMGLSTLAHDVFSLSACRLLVGIAIGAVLPAMAALAGEVAPERHRHYSVGLVQAGYPLAAIITGFVAAAVLPVYGWRALIGGAGVLTAILVPIIFAIMPREQREIAKGRGLPFRTLFSGDLRRATLHLWVGIFCGFFVLYFIVSWITSLSVAAGLSEPNAIYAGAIYNLGAFIGTLGMSVLAIRYPLRRIVPALLIPAAISMILFGSLALSVPIALLIAFAIGLTLQGGFNGIYPLCAATYPALLRSTGIGWAMAIGRAGAVLGPAAGGYLLAAKTPLPLLFSIFALPLLVCSVSIYRIRTGAENGN